MPDTLIHNPAAGKYGKDSESNKHVSSRWRYSNSVIPGHTEGGIVPNINPHAASQMQAVVDPKPERFGVSGSVIDVVGYTKEEYEHARAMAEQVATGDTDIDRRRNVAHLTLQMLADAQRQVQTQAAATEKQAAQPKPAATVKPASPKIPVLYDIPLFGKLPVVYDAVVIDGNQLIVSVDKELGDSTYFPGPSIEQPISVTVYGKTHIAHTTPLKYTIDGKTCAILMLETEG